MTPKKTATFICPHCNVHSLHTSVSDVETKKKYVHTPGTLAYYIITVHVIFECVVCKGETYCLISYETDPRRPAYRIIAQVEWSEALENGKGKILYQHPPANAKAHIAVEKNVAAATVEAQNCLSVGAYNASGVMTRRAIHSLCHDKKAVGKDLFAQLNDLKNKQLITPDLHDWADSLRALGRDGAHPEFPELTQEDAEDGVRLLQEIVKYTYILPQERAKKRQQRVTTRPSPKQS